MKFYSRNITADSLTGAVFALEGIRRSAVIMNAPTGCKFYHSAISDNQYPRQISFDPLNYPETFYFGQPRVPCTYLDSYDYVYGSKDKLNALLDFIHGEDYALVAIVNSPGAALIGDDLEGIARAKLPHTPLLVIENPGFSQSFYKGFQDTLQALLKNLPLVKGLKKKNSINLIGISIFNKYYRGDIEEIERLLKLCGIETNCVLCADTSLDDLRRIPQAALNVILYPELGLDIARYLEEAYGMPYFLFDKGLPIGFDLTEAFLSGVCEKLYGDALPTDEGLKDQQSSFTMELEKARVDAYLHLSRIHSLTGLPRGVTFSVEALSSSLYAYTDFFLNYLGMIPNAIDHIKDDPCLFTDKLRTLLEKHHLEQGLHQSVYEAESDLVFSNGSTIAQLKLKGHAFSGIEIELPSLGYIDVFPKTHLGIKGSLLLVEQILNGMNFS
ncbi:Nitrogenase molybdenum-iron protein, alpha and beta chains [Anaerovirgula multivorans]|uniref:Nitrogenase molybdenum-iron protein, alpha and beta chains n=1 Tax=Anaerovirgula multivorans TaxID=312168 RepID=A0A239C826_9FIRM|nr:nitrogenase component 1 [Anaerovirgula multivorans]SNS16377.1 Nitrogenase molybdenum-iron protein, alpha and beta chains [Anaerovirgula multivorans]